ncbi:RNA-directed DNA polymerase, eukaryota, reverse transcriptase zinc-binding domain protein [Tanacetum coccineum]
MKGSMKKLSWKNGNLFDNVEKCRDTLKIAQKNMDKHPYYEGIKSKEAKCLAEYMDAINDEEKLPIACCNVLYKCVSKIFTNRIKSGLDKLVNFNQSAFVPGRVIQDNLMISQELLKCYNFKNGPSICALKIDIVKAYDIVNWSFLKKILLKFGFHRRMVDWIITCISSATFIIGLNGERHGYFRSRRERLWKVKKFKFHKGCKEMKLNYLSFVDDLLLISHGDVDSIQVIKEALIELSNSSGLIPNMDKSVIFFGSVKEPKKLKILEVLPFNVRKLPVKYLSIPLLAKRLGIKDYKQLVDKVKGKIQHWKNKALSYVENVNPPPTNNPPVLLTVLRAKIVQELNELQAISTYIVSRLENIDRFLNGFTQQPNEIDVDDLEPDDELVDTPLVSPFLDSDDDSDDGEVLNELEEYGNAGQLCR